MSFQTIVTPADLAAKTADAGWAVVDCRFSLDDVERGRRAYREAHVPGAVYAHLDQDLSAPMVGGRTGRHPLPEPDRLAERLSAWGIADGVQVVVYDDSFGAIAGRLWFLLRWLGHSDVALLDGGWQRWIAEGRPTRSGDEVRPGARFLARPRPDLLVSADQLQRHLRDPEWRIVDARAGIRFRGEQEPLDRVAGHIPGAVSSPYSENLTPEGCFDRPERLHARWRDTLGETPAERTVFYCGSGVSAAHNLVAYLHAGLGEARLYAGSWSEWITDPSRPIETGPTN